MIGQLLWNPVHDAMLETNVDSIRRVSWGIKHYRGVRGAGRGSMEARSTGELLALVGLGYLRLHIFTTTMHLHSPFSFVERLT